MNGDKRPVVAFCYDFDRTLTPDDMQAQGYIQDIGYDVARFWEESNRLAAEHAMDRNLAYMYRMVEGAEGQVIVNRKALMAYGGRVALYDGVDSWFSRVRSYGAEKGLAVEHYIISSGLKEMIEGTEPAKRGEFSEIYASSFYFNERGVAKWPAQAVNFTNKTQFLFRISKGTMDVNDDRVNDYMREEELRVPFRNFVYIGDSATDIPCMKLVNSYGGHSVGVYDGARADRAAVCRMLKENRIRYFSAADYRAGSELETLVFRILDKIAADEVLYRFTAENKKLLEKS